MPFKIIIHIQGTEPVVGEVDELPARTDTLIIVKNPRKPDGKDLTFLIEETETVIWPIERLNYIEVLSSEGDERIIGFVRE